MDNSRDRRAALIASSRFNGIDFVEIADVAQTTLTVHFFNGVSVKGSFTAAPTISGGETIASVVVMPVSPADWSNDDGHETLTLRVAAPGDFSTYRLALASAVLDPFYSSVPFSFKAGCSSDLDCEGAPPACPPLEGDTPPIDYLAKDFLSFRQALLDFSALRYPQWQERSEADFGVTFLEALCALGDDLSYTQDRIAAEASLATATQRRSVVRHARLVDYQPRPLLSASVMLQFDVTPGATSVPFGTPVWARDPGGERIVFETGPSLAARLLDASAQALLDEPPADAVSALWNRGQIAPYWFDDSELCLSAGATSMSVLGHGFAFREGQALLIETDAADSADPPIRQIVHLVLAGDPAGGTWADERCDPLFLRAPDSTSAIVLTCDVSPPPSGASPALMPTAVTFIRWQDADALRAPRDLRCTRVIGNLVGATQGVTFPQEAFSIAPADGSAPTGAFAPPTSVVRRGAQASDGGVLTVPPVHLYSLAQAPLAWLALEGCADPGIGTGAGQPFNTPSRPEIVLTSIDADNLAQVWGWQSSMLSAGRFAAAFMLDDMRLSRIARNSDQTDQFDYDADDASTLRFGDGTFGAIPQDGTAFAATYRVAVGARGNVAADSITGFDPGRSPQLLAVTNPVAAAGGDDAQSLAEVKSLAPAAFRAVQFRAVLPQDYVDAAQTQPWVQRAGCVFRWTGSWLTVFTTPDPRHSEAVAIGDRLDLVQLLNRYRLAGYESYVPDPHYVAVDLIVEVCAQPRAFRGDVDSGLARALSIKGFFDPDNFSFGQALERSRLEAAIAAVVGVQGVLCIEIRVRGRSLDYAPLTDKVAVGVDQIIRCDNDPSRPENGAIKLVVRGGK